MTIDVLFVQIQDKTHELTSIEAHECTFAPKVPAPHDWQALHVLLVIIYAFNAILYCCIRRLTGPSAEHCRTHRPRLL